MPALLGSVVRRRQLFYCSKMPLVFKCKCTEDLLLHVLPQFMYLKAGLAVGPVIACWQWNRMQHTFCVVNTITVCTAQWMASSVMPCCVLVYTGTKAANGIRLYSHLQVTAVCLLQALHEPCRPCAVTDCQGLVTRCVIDPACLPAFIIKIWTMPALDYEPCLWVLQLAQVASLVCLERQPACSGCSRSSARLPLFRTLI